MNTQTLEIKVAIQILKPAHQVFEAIVDPAKMSHYFIARGSGRMEAEQSVLWRFPEFDMDVPIRVGRIEKDRFISFYWDVDENEHLTEIFLSPREDEDATVVTVTEKGRANDEAGINWLKGNTEGWANFLASLKAYLEYGINLRKGAFDFRKT